MGRLLVCTLSALLLCQTFLPADPLAEAKRAEQKGDIEGALTGYTQWVTSQPALDREVDTLFRTLEGIPDLQIAMKLLDVSLPKLKDPVNRSRALYLQASLWERMGAFEPAQRAYHLAYRTHPAPSSFPYLLRSAHLLFELGELEESEKQTRFALSQAEKPEDRWEAQFHLARIFAVTHRSSDALTVGKRLLEESASYRKDSQALLYFLYTVTGTLGLKKEQATYREALEKIGGLLKNFVSPDGKTRITPLPLPSLFFSDATLPVASDTPPPLTLRTIEGTGMEKVTKSSPPPRATGIQVGSFSQKENAEYLARDLRTLGFPILVKQGQRKDGSFLYRTIVPLPTDPSENPQTVLIKLKEHGFEGFFIFETNGE